MSAPRSHVKTLRLEPYDFASPRLQDYIATFDAESQGPLKKPVPHASLS
jgi:hypothetical protein